MTIDAGTEWRADAECRRQGATPGLFYPKRWRPADVAEARWICDECPVRVHCLAFALDNGEKYGIWGGLTPRQRKALLAKSRGETDADA